MSHLPKGPPMIPWSVGWARPAGWRQGYPGQRGTMAFHPCRRKGRVGHAHPASCGPALPRVAVSQLKLPDGGLGLGPSTTKQSVYPCRRIPYLLFSCTVEIPQTSTQAGSWNAVSTPSLCRQVISYLWTSVSSSVKWAQWHLSYRLINSIAHQMRWIKKYLMGTNSP